MNGFDDLEEQESRGSSDNFDLDADPYESEENDQKGIPEDLAFAS